LLAEGKGLATEKANAAAQPARDEDSGDVRLQRLIDERVAVIQDTVIQDTVNSRGESTGTSDCGSSDESEDHTLEVRPEQPQNCDRDGCEGADQESSGSSGWPSVCTEVGDADGEADHADHACQSDGECVESENATLFPPAANNDSLLPQHQDVGCEDKADEETSQFLGIPTVEMWLGAAASGNVKLLRAMHARSPHAVEWVDDYGRAALHLASGCSQGAAAVDFLISVGANATACDEKGRTGLHISAASGFWWICDKLIRAGCHVDTPDIYHRTALMLSSWHGSLKTAMRLLSLNADPMMRDRHLCTPLHIASWKGSHVIVTQILASLADHTARKAGGAGGGDREGEVKGNGEGEGEGDGVGEKDEGLERERGRGGGGSSNMVEVCDLIDSRDSGGGTALHKASINV
jgi:ankyrin repeat protein